MNNTLVRKLILPVAGLGKRLRPLTLRRPKALVPLAGMPLLSYMLHDAAISGINEVIIVASPQHKKAFTSYIKKNKSKFPAFKKIHLVIQQKPMGDGHAVLQALHLFKKEPVAVRFSDDLILGDHPTVGSLIRFFDHHQAPVLLLERVPKKYVSRYGIVGIRKTLISQKGFPQGSIHELNTFVEKPRPKDAPSNLSVVGGYVLTPKFIRHLSHHARMIKGDHNDALRLADVFSAMVARGEKIYGWQFKGSRLDCGTLEGFYRAEESVRRNRRESLKK